MAHTTTADQIAAIEIFLEHLIIVIEAEDTGFTLQKLDAWLNTSIQRMLATDSASPSTIGALWALQARLMGA